MKPDISGLYSLENLQRFADLMEDRFRIPGTRYRVGWDFIIGLIPVAGDIVTAIASLYILVGAYHHNVRKRTIARMLLNVIIDLLVGSVPLLGDILDASFRSNKKNVNLLLNYLKSHQDQDNLQNPKR